jgi:hypothetical protein
MDDWRCLSCPSDSRCPCAYRRAAVVVCEYVDGAPVAARRLWPARPSRTLLRWDRSQASWLLEDLEPGIGGGYRLPVRAVQAFGVEFGEQAGRDGDGQAGRPVRRVGR